MNYFNINLIGIDEDEEKFINDFNLCNLKQGDILYYSSFSDCSYNFFVKSIENNDFTLIRIKE